MILGNPNTRMVDEIEVECDLCNKKYSLLHISAKRVLKRHGFMKCGSCASKESSHKKPQCNREYWNNDKVAQHSERVKHSEKYRAAVKEKKMARSGSLNGWYGKRHSTQTRLAMSILRKGKIGVNATAWKGGRCSLNKRIKGALQKRHNWFGRVFLRDKVCQHCGGSGKLDAHHVIPIITIMKNLLNGVQLADDDSKLEWLMLQPEILDNDLKNGIALCRPCHQKIHKNWGSRNAP